MESYEISSPPHDPPFSAPGSPPPSDDTHLSANDALLADDIRGKIIKQVVMLNLMPNAPCISIKPNYQSNTY
ncbi:hypothetical protein CK203_080885 [Vitis vinifera]|uniref:Uncharacterized protein n=1 Tax=Vitis vinifera TaxID=29760 RepID=A0A438C077_VITVI|nr:hypothetical protein CK203_080885 [Vitis vinifera]